MSSIELIRNISYNVSAQEGRKSTLDSTKKKQKDAVKNATSYCLGEMNKQLEEMKASGKLVMSAVAHNAALRQIYDLPARSCSESDYHRDFEAKGLQFSPECEFAFRAVVQKKPADREITVITSKSSHELLNKAVKTCGKHGEINLAIVSNKGLNQLKNTKTEVFQSRYNFFPGLAPEIEVETPELRKAYVEDLGYQVMTLSDRANIMKELYEKSQKFTQQGIDTYVQIRNSLEIQLERLLSLRESFKGEKLESDTYNLRMVPSLSMTFTEDGEIDISKSKIPAKFRNIPIDTIISRLKAVVPNYEEGLKQAREEFQFATDRYNGKAKQDPQQEEEPSIQHELSQDELSFELKELKDKREKEAKKLPEGVKRFVPHGGIYKTWHAERQV